MGAELQPAGHAAEVVLPHTGEIVNLAGTTDQLAEVLDEIRVLEGRLRDAKAALTGEVLARMDREARWTWTGNGLSMSSQSPPKPGYDGTQLEEALGPLVADGTIGQAAKDAAVEVRVQFVARQRGINALLALDNPAVNEAVESARTVAPKGRYVTVRQA